MELHSFVLSAVLLLGATSVAVAIFKHLGLGSVLGLLVAGIAVGPHSPGPYVTPHVEDVRHFTELGVVLLLFLIGLEMQPRRLWALRREVFGMGALQILLSGAAVGLYVSLRQQGWQVPLLIGLTMALSSTAFVMQMLAERGEIASPHGRSSFAVLLMQDLAVVPLPLLALVPIFAETGTLTQAHKPLWEVAVVLAMFVVVWGFGRLGPAHPGGSLGGLSGDHRGESAARCGDAQAGGIAGGQRGPSAARRPLRGLRLGARRRRRPAPLTG